MIQKHGPKHEIAENIRNIPTNARNNTKLTITTTSKHCIRESDLSRKLIFKFKTILIQIS